MTPDIAAKLGQHHLLRGDPIEAASAEPDWCLTTDPHTRNLEPFVFLHTPKTAGSTFRLILRSLFDEARIYPGANFPDFDPKTLQRNLSSEAHNVFLGHMTWNAIDEIERLRGRKANVFTIFRNPVSHLHSQLAFHDRLAEQGSDPGASGGVTVIGMQIALLVGLEYEQISEDYAQRGLSTTKLESFRNSLESARITLNKRLESGLRLGIFEDLRASLDLMCSRYRLPYIAIPDERLNASGAQLSATLSPSDRSYIDDWQNIFFDFDAQARVKFEADYYGTFYETAEVSASLNEIYKAEMSSSMQRHWCVSLPASNAWPGFGWAPRQITDDGQIRRHIGRSGRAKIFARLQRKLNYVLRISICYVSSSERAESLLVRANSHLLEAKETWFDGGHLTVQMQVPAVCLDPRDGWLDLAFEIDPLVSEELMVSSISVIPRSTD